MRPRCLDRWFVAVASITVLAACSSSDDPSVADPAIVADTLDRYDTPRGYSIVTYLLEGDGSNRLELAIAEESAVRTCLESSGFEYPSLGYTLAQFQNEIARPILVSLSVQQATEFGYRDPTGLDDLPAGNVAAGNRNAYANTLSASDRGTFDQLEVECIGLSRDETFEDFDAFEVARRQLAVVQSEFQSNFETSDAVADLFDEWRDCMSDAGFDGELGPIETRQNFARSTDSATGQQAIVDAQCREAIDFEDRYLEQFYAAETAFLVDNEATVFTVFEQRYGHRFEVQPP